MEVAGVLCNVTWEESEEIGRAAARLRSRFWERKVCVGVCVSTRHVTGRRRLRHSDVYIYFPSLSLSKVWHARRASPAA